MSRKLRVWSTPILLIAAAASLGLYGFWWEPSGLRAVTHAVTLDPGRRVWPRPLRIAVIADLHAGAPYIGMAKIDQVTALVRKAGPDLVLLVGDTMTKGVLGGRPIPIADVLARLNHISAPLGIYAVLGNHERFFDLPVMIKAFSDAGIILLEDKSARIEGDGAQLTLVGISDFHSGPHDIGRAFAAVPHDENAVCLTHSPDVFPLLPKTCALTVAGHTHGGQVKLPLVGRLVVPSQYGDRYAAGLVRQDSKTLFVSTGIGTSIVPVRIGVPPEVSILDVD